MNLTFKIEVDVFIQNLKHNQSPFHNKEKEVIGTLHTYSNSCVTYQFVALSEEVKISNKEISAIKINGWTIARDLREFIDKKFATNAYYNKWDEPEDNDVSLETKTLKEFKLEEE